MSASEHTLLTQSRAILDAADHEDWERLTDLLATFDTDSHSRQFTLADKELLSSLLALVNESTEKVIRRREEIRNLVNSIGDTPR